MTLHKKPKPKRNFKEAFLKTAYQRKHMRKTTRLRIKSELDQSKLSDFQ